LQGYLTNQQLKELIDHLYFAVIYVLPSMIDTSHPYHNQAQFIKLEMLKNVSEFAHFNNMI
jgi:hypothetical protein